jgi:Gram-negative bacterial TonB protein C-terminal
MHPYRDAARLTAAKQKVWPIRLAMAACALAVAGSIGLVAGANDSAPPDPKRVHTVAFPMRDPIPDPPPDPPPPPPPDRRVSEVGVIPFRPGMTSPERQSGPELYYSLAAIEAKSTGIATARCIVEIDGRLTNCAVTKSVPFMDEHVLYWLRGSRYSCVKDKGRCQRVRAEIPVQVPAPP